MNTTVATSPTEPEPTDRRARRTRRALREALVHALRDRPWHEISVAGLAREADISRPTFYLHFQSVEELLAHLIETTLGPTIAAVPDEMLALPIAENGLTEHAMGIWDENADLIRLFVTHAPHHVFAERLTHHITDLYRRFSTLNGVPTLADREADYVIGFVAGATFGMISTWATRGLRERPNELARLFGLLIAPGLDRTLTK